MTCACAAELVARIAVNPKIQWTAFRMSMAPQFASPAQTRSPFVTPHRTIRQDLVCPQCEPPPNPADEHPATTLRGPNPALSELRAVASDPLRLRHVAALLMKRCELGAGRRAGSAKHPPARASVRPAP